MGGRGVLSPDHVRAERSNQPQHPRLLPRDFSDMPVNTSRLVKKYKDCVKDSFASLNASSESSRKGHNPH